MKQYILIAVAFLFVGVRLYAQNQPIGLGPTRIVFYGALPRIHDSTVAEKRQAAIFFKCPNQIINCENHCTVTGLKSSMIRDQDAWRIKNDPYFGSVYQRWAELQPDSLKIPAREIIALSKTATDDYLNRRFNAIIMGPITTSFTEYTTLPTKKKKKAK